MKHVIPEPGGSICVSATVRQGSHCLWATTRWLGKDLVVDIGGGDSPHVGSVVLAVPVPSRSRPGHWSASCSVLTVTPHKEEPIARAVATRLTEELGCTTVAVAGVHEDDLDAEGVRAYLELGARLAEELVSRLERSDED